MLQQCCIRLRSRGEELNSAVRSNFLYDLGENPCFVSTARRSFVQEHPGWSGKQSDWDELADLEPHAVVAGLFLDAEPASSEFMPVWLHRSAL